MYHKTAFYKLYTGKVIHIEHQATKIMGYSTTPGSNKWVGQK
jgi:hypothetical protein